VVVASPQADADSRASTIARLRQQLDAIHQEAAGRAAAAAAAEGTNAGLTRQLTELRGQLKAATQQVHTQQVTPSVLHSAHVSKRRCWNKKVQTLKLELCGWVAMVCSHLSAQALWPVHAGF
jgi:uncharacterized protein involved in exopolysaccharide biosynthesis